MAKTATRFYRRGDLLTSRLCWVLTEVFGLGEAACQDLLEDSRRRVLMLVDAAGQLAGFVVFVDRQEQLLSAENAFVDLEDRQLLATKPHAVYGFDQVWFRGGEFDTARVLRELLPVMGRELQAQGSYSLLAIAPEDDKASALRALLAELGFEPGERAHGDWIVELRAASGEQKARKSGIQSFAHPPVDEELRSSFARAFGDGAQVLSAEQLQDLYRRPDFLSRASLWLPQGERVVLFAWLFAVAPSHARLALLASDPQIRGRGRVGERIAEACSLWLRLGIEHLHFTIREDNAAPQVLARRLGARLTRTKRVWLCSGEAP